MSLFINVTDSASAAYDELRLHYAEGDYNAQYIRKFEPWIEAISSENLIQEHPGRRELKNYPLPPDDAKNQILPREVFELYLTFYKKVLRDIHAIGGYELIETTGEGDDSERTIDPFAEYRRREGE